MEHFVVVNDWAYEYESGTTILGVTHSLEEAKEIFNQSYTNEKRYAEEHGYEIYDDCETVFDAGEEGYYVNNHTNLYIQLVR
jgi:hypothetical protein